MIPSNYTSAEWRGAIQQIATPKTAMVITIIAAVIVSGAIISLGVLFDVYEMPGWSCLGFEVLTGGLVTAAAIAVAAGGAVVVSFPYLVLSHRREKLLELPAMSALEMRDAWRFQNFYASAKTSLLAPGLDDQMHNWVEGQWALSYKKTTIEYILGGNRHIFGYVADDRLIHRLTNDQRAWMDYQATYRAEKASSESDWYKLRDRFRTKDQAAACYARLSTVATLQDLRGIYCASWKATGLITAERDQQIQDLLKDCASLTSTNERLLIHEQYAQDPATAHLFNPIALGNLQRQRQDWHVNQGRLALNFARLQRELAAEAL